MATSLEAVPGHFVLVKREGISRSGAVLSARKAAEAVLTSGLWPLWKGTRNRRAMKAGDRVAVYLAGKGNQVVIATALVARVSPWTSAGQSRYPLIVDDTPQSVLHLETIELLPDPVHVPKLVGQLSFLSTENTRKWGVAFMGGCRMVSHNDYRLLTGRAAENAAAGKG